MADIIKPDLTIGELSTIMAALRAHHDRNTVLADRNMDDAALAQLLRDRASRCKAIADKLIATPKITV
jgi:hypothetical protein